MERKRSCRRLIALAWKFVHLRDTNLTWGVRGAARLLRISLSECKGGIVLALWLTVLFNGLSLSSILLLIALGLAFSFGLMKVINMAHGELIMAGAYVAYVISSLFSRWLMTSQSG